MKLLAKTIYYDSDDTTSLGWASLFARAALGLFPEI